MRCNSIRTFTTLVALIVGLGVSAEVGHSEQNLLSVSKHASQVRSPNSQGRDTYTVTFPTDVCIRGAWMRAVGPSGNILTLLSLDPDPPFTPAGMEGRSDDLFFVEASGLDHTLDVNKEVFLPSAVCRLVPAGAEIFIYTLDDVGNVGGAFDHVEIIYYTLP